MLTKRLDIKLMVLVLTSENANHRMLAMVDCADNIRWFGFEIPFLSGNTLEIAFQNVVVESEIPLVMYYEDYIKKISMKNGKESQKFKVSSLGRVQYIHKYRVHCLVALAFFPKEECKEFASNLEGHTKTMYNMQCLRLQDGWMRQRAIKQIFDDGSFREFLSLAEAQRVTGIKSQNIGLVCRGLQANA
ncbi:hypothetical protein Glove_122g10 [Diversispora epigaea]|uniref:Uncharacterized protein n=1 Tax=Diversispora epigaea TaxID=1348612 RepID=A0A397J7X7_9GLOM|nr:hypothetical protein Glove_122g10 [Diversispora epigaea]